MNRKRDCLASSFDPMPLFYTNASPMKPHLLANCRMLSGIASLHSLSYNRRIAKALFALIAVVAASPNPLLACPPDECSSDADCPDGEVCEGENRFSVINGNASRAVTDLIVHGAALGEFTWRRIHNTYPRPGAAPFGVGGSWRHSWQYDLVERPGSAVNGPGLALLYPSGIWSEFESAAGGGWTATGQRQEKLTTTPDGIDVTTIDGIILHFVHQSSGELRYRLQMLSDPQGSVCHFNYDNDGNLVQIIEPSGRFFKLNYKPIPFQRGAWHELMTISKAPVNGQWIEFAVSGNLSSVAFSHLRLRGAREAAIAIAELQFIAPNTNSPLRGIANGTGSAASAAFDGDPTTIFRSNRSDSNVCGIELGADGRVRIARVRVLAAPGAERSLVGAVVEGLELVSSIRSVVAQVTASDGRSVDYGYTVLADPVSRHEFVALETVRYIDATQATYHYGFVRANTRPLLVEAADTRYEGRAMHICYTYHDQLGMIHQEINPTTGNAYVSLEIDPQYPLKRLVTYTDMHQIAFQLSDDKLHVAQRTDSLGRTTRFERDAFGRITAKIDHENRRTEFARDTGGHIATEQRAGKLQKQFVRDQNGRLVIEIDRYGRATEFERDLAGRVARETHPDGTMREFSHDSLGRVISQRERDGAVHRFVYDGRGLKTAWIDPTGQTHRYAYDNFDRAATHTDPLGRITRFEYNERDLVTKIGSPESTIQRSYDTYGRKIAETDTQGRISEFAYDELGRLIRQKDATGGVTTYGYADIVTGCGSCALAPRPTRIVFPDGTVTSILYDTEGRLLARTVAVGTADEATTTYAYDSDDNLVSKTSPSGMVTRCIYDEDGHRLACTDPLGRVTKWTYDERGNVLSVTGPDGAIVRQTFDINDRRTSNTDANGATTRFSYDGAGRTTSLTEARGNTYRFTYDAMGRKTIMLYPDDSRENWTYDSAGQVATYTTRDRQVMTIACDVTGRLVSETWSPVGAASNVGYTYDTAGRVASITNGGTTLRYGYDSSGRMVSETTDLAGLLPGLSSSTVAYTYDAMSRPTRIIYPDGTSVKQTYNARGQLATVGTGEKDTLATWAYSTNGLLAAVRRANGVDTEYKYDDADQLTEVAHNKGNEMLALARYTLDAAGRHITQLREDNLFERYGYDASGQLTSVDYGISIDTTAFPSSKRGEGGQLLASDQLLAAHSVTYAYDILGNRQSMVDIVRAQHGPERRTVTTYETNNLNQYVQVAIDGIADQPNYDGKGNLTSLGATRNQFDALNHLVEAQKPDLRVTFAYDSKGRCVLRRYYSKNVQGQWVENVNRGQVITYSSWNAIAERTIGGQPIRTYIHGMRPDEIIASREEVDSAIGISNVVYPLADGLGTTVALSTAQGEISQRYRYDVFGEPSGTSAASSNYRYLFTGREWIPDVQLNDNRFRYYLASQGRWLTTDPIRFAGRDENLYRYVRNNATNEIDPNGEGMFMHCVFHIILDICMGHELPYVDASRVLTGTGPIVFDERGCVRGCQYDNISGHCSDELGESYQSVEWIPCLEECQ